MQQPDNFLAAIIIGAWVAIIIGLGIYFGWKRRREDAELLDAEVSYTRVEEEWDQWSSTERQARPSRFRCFKCGEYITGGEAVCPKCKAKQQRCMVCKQFIGQEELYNSCPHCKQLAHRNHLLEWLKVKGTCPYCKRNLQPSDVV